MSLIYGFRDKTEAQAGEISKLSDGKAGQPKINKEDIATTTGRVNKMALKYFTLKNGQYVVNAKVETNKTDIASLAAGQVETNKTDIAALAAGQVETNKDNITQLSGTKASKLNFFSLNNGLSIANTKITNNKAEIDTISAGLSNLSNGTAGFVKKNKLGVAANKTEIDKLKKNNEVFLRVTNHTRQAEKNLLGPAGIRTRDLRFTSPMLYQLSYRSSWELVVK